jgi:hypothetical protein
MKELQCVKRKIAMISAYCKLSCATKINYQETHSYVHKTLDHSAATPCSVVAGEAFCGESLAGGADDSRFSEGASLYHAISNGFPCSVFAPRASATSASRRFLNCTMMDSTSSLYDTASN